MAKVDSKFDQKAKIPSANIDPNKPQRQKTIEDIAREQGSIKIEDVVGVNPALTK